MNNIVFTSKLKVSRLAQPLSNLWNNDIFIYYNSLLWLVVHMPRHPRMLQMLDNAENARNSAQSPSIWDRPMILTNKSWMNKGLPLGRKHINVGVVSRKHFVQRERIDLIKNHMHKTNLFSKIILTCFQMKSTIQDKFG